MQTNLYDSPQRLVNGWPTEADNAGDLTDSLALSAELSDCFFFLFGQGHTAAGFATTPSLSGGPCRRLTGQDPLCPYLCLELGNGRQDVGH